MGHIRTLIVEVEQISEMVVYLNNLMWLSAWEVFTEYILKLVLLQTLTHYHGYFMFTTYNSWNDASLYDAWYYCLKPEQLINPANNLKLHTWVINYLI